MNTNDKQPQANANQSQPQPRNGTPLHNAQLYQNNAVSTPQKSGQYQQYAGQYPQNAGQYQQYAAQYQQNTGQYQQNAGQYQQHAGQYQQNRGQYQQYAGQYQQNRGQYQQYAGKYQQYVAQYQQNTVQHHQDVGASKPYSTQTLQNASQHQQNLGQHQQHIGQCQHYAEQNKQNVEKTPLGPEQKEQKRKSIFQPKIIIGSIFGFVASAIGLIAIFFPSIFNLETKQIDEFICHASSWKDIESLDKFLVEHLVDHKSIFKLSIDMSSLPDEGMKRIIHDKDLGNIEQAYQYEAITKEQSVEYPYGITIDILKIQDGDVCGGHTYHFRDVRLKKEMPSKKLHMLDGYFTYINNSASWGVTTYEIRKVPDEEILLKKY